MSDDQDTERMLKIVGARRRCHMVGHRQCRGHFIPEGTDEETGKPVGFFIRACTKGDDVFSRPCKECKAEYVPRTLAQRKNLYKLGSLLLRISGR